MKPHLSPRYRCPPGEVYVVPDRIRRRPQIIYHPSVSPTRAYARAYELWRAYEGRHW